MNHDSDAILQIDHASRAFTDSPALADVTLRVSRGEILALLGPNGAGKTTLMRAAAGRLRLDSGSVTIGGKNPLTENAARSSLGIVPQSIALYTQLSVRQNLDVFARLSGLRGAAIDAAIARALERADLADRAEDPVSSLSGGMQRRINIVAGTLHDPQLLILDEPTVGVDLRARETIHALLRTLRDSGMAILFSTHDFDQAAAVADRAAIMVAGHLRKEGPVGALIHSVFGDAREVIINLAAPAAAAVTDLLKLNGLSPADDTHTWIGALSGGYGELAELEQKLTVAGAHVASVSMREPGLAGVYRYLLGEEAS
jgi:ABC-2 type transport system ATP-binding protein